VDRENGKGKGKGSWFLFVVIKHGFACDDHVDTDA
jgi:hypothetical protein